jgi:phage shock protein E
MKKGIKLEALAIALLVLAALVYFGGGKTMDSKEAHAMVENGALLVDVRTPAEFSSGHIDGAINLPLDRLSGSQKKLGKDKDKPIIVYCRSGARSSRAKSILEGAGYTAVHNLGGMHNW